MADRPKVIVAEDEPALAKVLKLRLEIEGFDVRTAGDGAEALDLIAEERPDVLVCDLMMPVMDGHEVCRTIKSDPALKDIPVLILTALKATRERERLEKLGADAFSSKPYDSKQLTAAIRGLLE